jgi:hypothetical protein
MPKMLKSQATSLPRGRSLERDNALSLSRSPCIKPAGIENGRLLISYNQNEYKSKIFLSSKNLK